MSDVAIDPRIKERRVAVQREAGRRRLRVLLGVLGVIAVAALGLAALHSPLADVDDVRVEGAARTAPASIQEAADLVRRRQLVDVDPEATARRIEALPWVASAAVTRHWPSSVVIAVRERRAVVAAPVDPEGKQWALLDGEGRVLAHRESRPGGVPALAQAPAPGAPGTMLGAGAAAALRVAAILPPELARRTGDVVVLPAGEVELALLPQGRVRLGRISELPAKIDALATVLARLDLTGIAVIDVRVPAAPAVTRA